jgi:hypothetical protein
MRGCRLVMSAATPAAVVYVVPLPAAMGIANPIVTSGAERSGAKACV